MASEPGFDLGVLVHGIVVESLVDRLASRHLALDDFEEADELPMLAALHVAADDGAVEHIERREERCRAVPLVVFGPLSGCGDPAPKCVSSRPRFIGNPGCVRSEA